jgi:hypothetical protein
VSDYYQAIEARPSQGDILELSPHSRLTFPLHYVSVSTEGFHSLATAPTENALAQVRLQRALLLTPDCELDKPATRFWHVCPIHELSSLNSNDQGNIRKNKIVKYLFLPAHEGMPESFVDLSWITTLESVIIGDTTRIFTLSDLSRGALYMQQIRWLSRWMLNDVKCPRCELQFNPADTLSVRAE